MRKLIASVCAAAALSIPVTAGAAHAQADVAATVRVVACPPHYTGVVVQAWNQDYRYWYDLVWLCVPPIAP